MNLFLRMGDVQVAFGILTHCFVQRPSYLLQCTPPSSIFIESLISFDFSLHKMFGHLLGLRSFNSPERPLAHKQTSLLIILSGVEFILTSTIAPTTYLGSWALIVPVITTRFMVDQCPFLLEISTRVNNNTFPFQQHFKATCDLLLPPACACLLPFEQLIGQQMVHLQDSILERLHHRALFSMISNGTYEVHRARILSCFSPRVSVWLKTRPIFPTFWLSSPISCIALHMRLGLPHPLIASIPWCVCTHPIDPMGIHLWCCVHGNKCIRTHDVICNTFTTITRDANFHMRQEQLHVLPSTTFNSSHQWVDIVLTKNGIRTLTDIVIADPTRANLLPRSCTTQGFATLDVVQAKERKYHN